METVSENDGPTVTGLYSPLCFIKESLPLKPLASDLRIKLHWIRYAWIAFFALVYHRTLKQIEFDEELPSGEVQGILSEFFPDQAMSYERITKGEISPTFNELMNGDDVSKILNWFQAFCMYKSGSDEHVPFSWSCTISNIDIGPTNPAAWNFIDNQGPTSQEWNAAKNFHQNESKEMLQRFCSREFISRHVIDGDDIESVPFGDVEAFRKRVRMQIAAEEGKVVSKHYMFAPTYDEWAVLNGNPMLNVVKRSAELSLQKEMPKLFSKGSPSSALQSAYSSLKRGGHRAQGQRHREEHFQRSGVLRSVHNTAILSDQSVRVSSAFLGGLEQNLKATSAQAAREAVSEALEGGHSSVAGANSRVLNAEAPRQAGPPRKSKLKSAAMRLLFHRKEALRKVLAEEQKIKETAKEPGLTNAGLSGVPPWCDRRGSEVLVFMTIARNLGFLHKGADGQNRGVYKSEGLFLFRAFGLNTTEAQFHWKLMDMDKTGIADPIEILTYVQKNRQIFHQNLHLHVENACRNHHFGMLHMCGPEFIKVIFRIEETHADLRHGQGGAPSQTEHRTSRRQTFLVNLRFSRIGYDQREGHLPDGASGWYQSQIMINTYTFPGAKTWFDFSLASATLLLFVPIFLIPLLYTLVQMPETLYSLFSWSRRSQITKPYEVQLLVCRLWDGRQVRSRFQSSFLGLTETVFTITFLGAVLHSYFICIYREDVPSSFYEGVWPSVECRDMFERNYVVTNKRTISQWKLLNGGCLEPWHPFLPELIYAVFFNMKLYHGIAILVLYFRLFDILNAFEGTMYLNTTLALAFRKLTYFSLFYMFNICSFATLLFFAFGGVFKQFMTYKRSCYVLMLYSFGFAEYAFDGVHPMQEKGAFLLTIVLVLFALVVIIVSMQFFTTIVLDTYTTVQNPRTLSEAKKEDTKGYIQFWSWLLFHNVQSEEHETPERSREDEAAEPQDDDEAECRKRRFHYSMKRMF